MRPAIELCFHNVPDRTFNPLLIASVPTFVHMTSTAPDTFVCIFAHDLAFEHSHTTLFSTSIIAHTKPDCSQHSNHYDGIRHLIIHSFRLFPTMGLSHLIDTLTLRRACRRATCAGELLPATQTSLPFLTWIVPVHLALDSSHCSISNYTTGRISTPDDHFQLHVHLPTSSFWAEYTFLFNARTSTVTLLSRGDQQFLHLDFTISVRCCNTDRADLPCGQFCSGHASCSAALTALSTTSPYDFYIVLRRLGVIVPSVPSVKPICFRSRVRLSRPPFPYLPKHHYSGTSATHTTNIQLCHY